MLRGLLPLSRPVSRLLAGVLAVAATGAILAFARQEYADAGIRFVDIEKVIIQAKAYQERIPKLREYAKKVEDQLNALKEEFGNKGAARKNLKEGSTEYDDLTLELLVLEDRMKFINTKAFERAKAAHGELINYVYEEIREAIRAYGQSRRLKAILVINEFEPPGEKGLSLSAQERQNVLRKVVYADPALDVTDEIVRLVNSK